MMDNKINGRTPEEIKRGLKCVFCEDCSYREYRGRDCTGRSRVDAIAYIQQLEDHLRDLTKKVQQLERERDAAVEQLRKGGRACSTCKFSEDIPENDKICEECRLTGIKLLYSNWEWVGPREVE